MQIGHTSELTKELGGKFVLHTNILIAIVDEQHGWHEKTLRFFEKMAAKNKGFLFFYVLASKLELSEYLRKKFYTNWLVETYGKGNHIFGPDHPFDEFCKNHEFVAEPTTSNKFLSDREIKHIRSACIRAFSTDVEGLKMWENISQLALAGRFKLAEETLNRVGIHYKGLHDLDIFDEANPPQWKDQEVFMKRFGLGSSDAAILNMVNSSPKINGLITNDSDLITIFRSTLVRKDVTCYSFIPSLLKESSFKKVG